MATMYSRKHYRDMAGVLSRSTKTVTDKKAHRETCEQWADHFAADNPRFDREKFMLAAGGYGRTAKEFIEKK